VKLRGRAEAPDSAEGAQSRSARGAKPQAHHCPLQRWLDARSGGLCISKRSRRIGMALFKRSLPFRVLLTEALQTCSACLEIGTVNRKARGRVALDKIVNPIHMTRCDEIHHREPHQTLVVEECETIRLELMGMRLAAENHSRDDAYNEDSDCCGPNCKPALHLAPRASNGEVEAGAATNEAAEAECSHPRSGATLASAAATVTVIPERFMSHGSPSHGSYGPDRRGSFTDPSNDC